MGEQATEASGRARAIAEGVHLAEQRLLFQASKTGTETGATSSLPLKRQGAPRPFSMVNMETMKTQAMKRGRRLATAAMSVVAALAALVVAATPATAVVG